MTNLINQLRINMLDLSLHENSKEKIFILNEIIEEKEEEEIYAKKGESNYNKAMDFNGDGIVTYNEYLRYCTENAVSQYSTNPSFKNISAINKTEFQDIRPIHIGLASNDYMHFGE